MKKLIFTFSIFLIFFNIHLLAQKIEFTPVNINFSWIEAKDDIVVACGDFGSIFISFNNGDSWQQKKIFDSEKVIRVIIEENRMVAFGQLGEAGISLDSGKTFSIKKIIEDSVYTVINYPNGYFVRAYNNLMIFDFDLKEINRYYLSYKTYYLPRGMMQSITYFRNSLIAVADSIKSDGGNTKSSFYLRFDENLNLIDTVSLLKLGLDVYPYGSYQIEADETYFYTYKYKIMGETSEDFFLRTKDLITWEKFCDITSYYSYDRFKIIGNNLYFNEWSYSSDLLKWGVKKVAYPNTVENINGGTDYRHSGSRMLKDFYYNKDRVFIVSDRKVLAVAINGDSVFSFYCDFNPSTSSDVPYIINDSTLFFPSKLRKGLYYRYPYISYDNGITFKPAVDGNDLNTLKNNEFLRFSSYLFHYYDRDKNLLYYIGSNDVPSPKKIPGVFISKDLGKTFEKKEIELPPYSPFNTFDVYPELKKVNDNFVFSINFSDFDILKNRYLTKTYTYDNDFNLLSVMLDSNLQVNYVASKDTNTFLFHCYNVIDSVNEVKFTTDKGANWHKIIRYQKYDSLLHCTDFKYKGKQYAALFYFREADSTCFIDAIDLEKYSIKTIYKTKIDFYYDPMLYEFNYKWVVGLDYINICDARDTVYIASNDTIFIVNDIDKKSTWDNIILPNNGKTRYCFGKIGDRFYANYTDDKNPINLQWIKVITDTTVSVSEKETDTHDYLNACPPFPLPATDRVQTLIYWDTNQEFSPGDVIVHNIYGEKVSKDEEITLDRLNSYSGYLRWDCSSVPNGVYLIKIHHGVTTRIVKAIVSR